MEYKKYGSYLATLSVALSTVVVPFSLEVPQLNAQPLYVSIKFPRTKVGAPRTATVGGGTRSSTTTCVNKDSKVTVLSPENNVVTTVSAQPTLFWYIAKTQAKAADFVVTDKQNPNQMVYDTTLTLTGIPGVVKLTLPRTVALATGKEYDWKLILKCNPEDEQATDVLVKGTIKPTVLTSTQQNQLAAAKQPLKQAEVYAQAGIWQETISILAQLRQNSPSDRDVNTAWKELLDSVGLQDIANEPLIECCVADK